MSTVNFYLDKVQDSGKRPIFLVYQDRGRKFKFFTKEKVLPKYWDKKKQRAKNVSDAPEINDLLDHYESKLKRVERQLRMSNEEYTFEDVKMGFHQKKEKKLSLFEYFEKLIKQVKATHKVKSLKEYRTVVNDLKEYQVFYKTTLTFEKLNMEFFSKYLTLLTEEKENTRNTVAKKLSTLRTLLNYATKAKVNTNLDYKDFKVKRIETEKSFLTKKELFKLYNLELSENKRLEQVRDVFCFGCFTGLRYSDIERLTFDDITTRIDTDGKEFTVLNFHVYKTKDLLMVPLNEYAIEIIKRYRKKAVAAISVINGNTKKLMIGKRVLPVISNQKMNDYVKEVCKIAEIDTPIVVTKYIGVNRIDTTHPKHDLISSHAARRTFAIVSLEQGMRVEVLQRILGHKSIRTTMKYVFIMEEVKNNEMQKAWKKDKN